MALLVVRLEQVNAAYNTVATCGSKPDPPNAPRACISSVPEAIVNPHFFGVRVAVCSSTGPCYSFDNHADRLPTKGGRIDRVVDADTLGQCIQRTRGQRVEKASQRDAAAVHPLLHHCRDRGLPRSKGIEFIAEQQRAWFGPDRVGDDIDDSFHRLSSIGRPLQTRLECLRSLCCQL
jgi:hypothetical protein